MGTHRHTHTPRAPSLELDCIFLEGALFLLPWGVLVLTHDAAQLCETFGEISAELVLVGEGQPFVCRIYTVLGSQGLHVALRAHAFSRSLLSSHLFSVPQKQRSQYSQTAVSWVSSQLEGAQCFTASVAASLKHKPVLGALDPHAHMLPSVEP